MAIFRWSYCGTNGRPAEHFSNDGEAGLEMAKAWLHGELETSHGHISQKWERAKALFNAALGLDSGARSASPRDNCEDAETGLRLSAC